MTKHTFQLNKKRFKLFLSKYSQIGSYFEDLVARTPTMQLKVNLDAQFKIYDKFEFPLHKGCRQKYCFSCMHA